MGKVRIVALLTWMFFFALALGLYVFWSEPLKRVVLNLLPLAASACFAVSFAGLGSIPARYFAAAHGRTIQFLTSTAFGAGMTGLLVFTLGLAGHFSRPVFLLWTLLGIALLVPAALSWRKMRPEMGSAEAADRIAAGTLMLFLVSAVPFAVAPELTTDALEYHLLIPKLYLFSGKIKLVPLLLESNYPSLVEYLYLPMLSLTESIVCKCFHYVMGLLLLVLMGKIVRRISPESSPFWAPALFVSMPVAAVVFGWAWNDLIYTFFILLSLYYLVSYQEALPENRSDRDLLLAGVAAGLAAWTKYTFAMFLLALLFLSWIGTRRWRWNSRKLVLLFAPIFFFISLWAVKNWLLTGNPVFPFLNEIFRSPYFTSEAFQYFKGTLTRYEFPQWGWKHHFLFPFYITLKAGIVDVYTGVMPLVLAPLLFFRSSSPGARLLKIYVVLYLVIWSFVQTEVRSLFSVLAIVFIVASVPLHRIVSQRNSLRVVARVLICAAIASNFFVTILSTYYLFDPVKLFLGRESREQYLTRMSKSQPVYDWLNRQEDAGVVLLIGQHNPFYLEKPFVFSSCCDPPIAEALTAKAVDAESLAAGLKKIGITHIVIDFREYSQEHRDGLFSWNDAQRRIFETFVNERCRRVGVFGRDAVFVMR